MTLRFIPPAYSPLRLSSVFAAARASLPGSGSAYTALVDALNRRFPDAKNTWLTDSGTSALTQALGMGKRLHPNAPVALPAYSCYDLATAAIGADVQVCFYDIVPETLEPDLVSLRAALERGARTVVAVHLFGYPVHMPALMGLAGEFGALVIEDAAQALGAEIGGSPAGSWGHLTVLSFGRGKGVTGGHGGALLLNDASLRERLATAAEPLPTNGGGVKDIFLVAALWALPRPTLYGLPARMPFLRLGETVYREPHPVASLSAAAAAAARSSLELAQAEIGVRRDHARWLRERLLDHPRLRLVEAPDAAAACLRLPGILEPGQADRMAQAGRALGIARGYPTALPNLPPLAGRVRDSTRSTGARALARGLVTLPTHSLLRERDRVRLVSWLREHF